MLESLFGNKTAARVLLGLTKKGSGYPTQLAGELGIPLNMVQKQMDRFCRGQIFISRFEGKRRIYSLNKRWPFYKALELFLRAISRRPGPHEEPPNPADGSALSLKNRVKEAEALYREAKRLNPYGKYIPFVRSFGSFKEYENWRKKQTNPWLI